MSAVGWARLAETQYTHAPHLSSSSLCLPDVSLHLISVTIVYSLIMLSHMRVGICAVCVCSCHILCSLDCMPVTTQSYSQSLEVTESPQGYGGPAVSLNSRLTHGPKSICTLESQSQMHECYCIGQKISNQVSLILKNDSTSTLFKQAFDRKHLVNKCYTVGVLIFMATKQLKKGT